MKKYMVLLKTYEGFATQTLDFKTEREAHKFCKKIIAHKGMLNYQNGRFLPVMEVQKWGLISSQRVR